MPISHGFVVVFFLLCIKYNSLITSETKMTELGRSKHLLNDDDIKAWMALNSLNRSDGVWSQVYARPTLSNLGLRIDGG